MNPSPSIEGSGPWKGLHLSALGICNIKTTATVITIHVGVGAALDKSLSSLFESPDRSKVGRHNRVIHIEVSKYKRKASR